MLPFVPAAGRPVGTNAIWDFRLWNDGHWYRMEDEARTEPFQLNRCPGPMEFESILGKDPVEPDEPDEVDPQVGGTS